MKRAHDAEAEITEMELRIEAMHKEELDHVHQSAVLRDEIHRIEASNEELRKLLVAAQISRELMDNEGKWLERQGRDLRTIV